MAIKSGIVLFIFIIIIIIPSFFYIERLSTKNNEKESFMGEFNVITFGNAVKKFRIMIRPEKSADILNLSEMLAGTKKKKNHIPRYDGGVGGGRAKKNI